MLTLRKLAPMILRSLLVTYLFFVFLEGKKHCIVFALFDRTCTAHVVACNAIAKTHILQRDSPIAFFVCGYNNTQCKCKIKAVKLRARRWLVDVNVPTPYICPTVYLRSCF